MQVRKRMIMMAGAAALLLAGGAGAQLLQTPRLPDVGRVLDGVGRVGGEALDTVGRAGATARELAAARTERLRDLVAAHPEALEMTPAGPAVRGQLIAIDPDAATIDAARAQGFRIVSEEEIEGLGIRSVVLEAPRGLALRRALAQLRRIAPGAEFVENHIHSRSGTAHGFAAGAAAQRREAAASPAVGIIDGGVAAHPSLAGPVEQRGFARGAPLASAHGTAVASLIAGSGAIRGAAPGAPLLVADIYGSDPAGGNALALARALGWMTERRVPVVAVSLVGPANSLVQRAIASAQARGVHVVAAVGNDGPAAPPAYPASYPGVVAVTAVDGRSRAIAEAGRALHLDYAAPGADMAAATPGGGTGAVRGTSYAVPFVAARIFRLKLAGREPVAALDAEAVDLGPRGPDRQYGRGLVCRDCRTPVARN